MRHILPTMQFIMFMALQQGFYLKYFSDLCGTKISFIVNYSGYRNLFLIRLSPQKPVVSAM